jgi:hypothetical protein
MADRGEFLYSCYRCFRHFPQFRFDYPVLESTGIIKPADNYLEWTKSKTSLAQYFKWISRNDKRRIEGGLWNPVEAAFWIKEKPIKQGSLSHNASRNGNEAKKEYSKDFVKIKTIVETYQEKVKREEAVEACFLKIKVIVESSGNDSFQESDRALKKIIKTIENYKDFVSKNE